MAQFEARIEQWQHGPDGENPQVIRMVAIDTNDRADLGAWLRAQAGAFEPARPSAGMLRTAATVEHPPARPCSETGCARIFGHHGLHVPWSMMYTPVATFSTGDDDAQWLHGPDGPFAEVTKVHRRLREAVAQRDKTLDELQNARRRAVRLGELLAEARRTDPRPGEVRIAAGAARTALGTLGRMMALTDDEGERWAYRNAHRRITAVLGQREGPASPLSATEGDEPPVAGTPETPQGATGRLRPSQAGGVWGSYVDYLAALERVYEAARAWRAMHPLPKRPVGPRLERIADAVDAFPAPGDFPADREPATGGAAAVLEVVEAARAWRSTYSKADFRNNAPRSRLAKAVDALDGIKTTDYVVSPEWADAARKIGWAAGVRWAAAEAGAQARNGMADTDIADITDHLRLCADNPNRETAVPRDPEA